MEYPTTALLTAETELYVALYYNLRRLEAAMVGLMQLWVTRMRISAKFTELDAQHQHF